MTPRIETRGRKRRMSKEAFRERYEQFYAGRMTNLKAAEDIGLPLSTFNRYLAEMRSTPAS